VRRALVGQGNGSGLGLALGLAFHHEPDPGLEPGDLARLRGDDLGELVDGAGEVGEAFLDPGEIFHGGPIAQTRRAREGAGQRGAQPATTCVVTAA